MSIVHWLDLNGPTIYHCAQSGCSHCLERLLRHHAGLVHAVLRRQACGDATYADLLQEGRIGLWHAILHFDPERGLAFSTYAWVAIEHRLWRAVAQADQRATPLGLIRLASVADLDGVEQPRGLGDALWEALCHLPPRLREVVQAAYGLAGEPPRSLAAVGRDYGVSRERARQWRNEALAVLRLPAVSGRLRRLCGQDDRAAYQQAQALNRTWARRRRGSHP